MSVYIYLDISRDCERSISPAFWFRLVLIFFKLFLFILYTLFILARLVSANMAPPKFEDLGKPAADVFNKGYSKKFEWIHWIY